MSLLDRYIAAQMAKPFFASVAIVIMLLSLENSARLMGQLDDVNQPFVVLMRFMGYLIPEYLSLGLVFALFVAVALALRAFALSGELDIFAAIGVSPLRLLRVPILAALACALVQFGVRSYAEPWGESQLDELGQSLRAGKLGVAIAAGDFLTPSPQTVLHVARIDPKTRHFEQIMVRSDDLTIFARNAVATNAGSNGLILNLAKGQILRKDSQGAVRMTTFEQMQMSLSKQSEAAEDQSVRDQNSRLNLNDLAELASGSRSSKDARGARATLASRAALALLVLLFPFMALGLAVPPKRGRSAFGLGLAITLIVIYVQTSNAIENNATATSPLQTALLLSLFTGLAAALYQTHRVMGAGFVEDKLQRALAPLSRFVSRLVAH